MQLLEPTIKHLSTALELVLGKERRKAPLPGLLPGWLFHLGLREVDFSDWDKLLRSLIV